METMMRSFLLLQNLIAKRKIYLFQLPELPETLVVNIGQFTLGLIHGHQAGDEEALNQVQAELNCNVLISGHTHESRVQRVDDIYFINPGSATGAPSALRPMTEPSFIIIEFRGEGIAFYTYQFANGKINVKKSPQKLRPGQPLGQSRGAYIAHSSQIY
eukprot:TRINITY_DN3647_c0_g1_i4.p1 TRINITY_DN3647_c0_g1~~TRINITY_DN3647_c0_g1_i4.p1  ORF type:complete len:159 (+),score=7.94 TRINITY_DN3647_c0_g1_i4:363-839(+)